MAADEVLKFSRGSAAVGAEGASKPASSTERSRKSRARKKAKAAPAPVPAASPTPTPTPIHRDRLWGASLAALGVALGGFGLIVNARYAAGNSKTPFDSALLAGFGVFVDGASIALLPGACALWQMRHRVAAPIALAAWVAATAYSMNATAGFVAGNIGDTVAGRASVLDKAAGDQAQRDQAIAIAKRTADAAAQTRHDECGTGRGKKCHDAETAEKKALADLQAKNDVPVVATPAISSPDPGADLFAKLLHLDQSLIRQIRTIGMMLPTTLAGLLLSFAGMLWAGRQ